VQWFKVAIARNFSSLTSRINAGLSIIPSLNVSPFAGTVTVAKCTTALFVANII